LGSGDGAVVRALASHQCGLGSTPARCHRWAEFVDGSHPCSEGFSPGSPVFLKLALQKPTLQIPIRSGKKSLSVGYATAIPIYFLFTLFYLFYFRRTFIWKMMTSQENQQYDLSASLADNSKYNKVCKRGIVTVFIQTFISFIFKPNHWSHVCRSHN